MLYYPLPAGGGNWVFNKLRLLKNHHVFSVSRSGGRVKGRRSRAQRTLDADGVTHAPREGAGEWFSPLPPEGPARPLVGVGEAHGFGVGAFRGDGAPKPPAISPRRRPRR